MKPRICPKGKHQMATLGLLYSSFWALEKKVSGIQRISFFRALAGAPETEREKAEKEGSIMS